MAGSDQGVRASLVSRSLPEHATSQAEVLEVRDLGVDHVRGIERDELLAAGVIAVVCLCDRVILDCSASLRKNLVVPDTVLPASRSNSIVGLANATGALERSPIDGHAKNDLACGNTSLDIVLDSLIGVVRRGVGVGRVSKQVGIVSRVVAPRTSIVIGHEVDIVEDLAKV